MLLEFTQPFGHHKPGEVIEVPDGVTYDTSYLKEASEDAEVTVKVSEQEKPAAGAPRYRRGE